MELTNEKTLWMYDKFSLSEVLRRSKFSNVKVLDFNISKIDIWDHYKFDQSEKGNYPIEHSVYVEGLIK